MQEQGKSQKKEDKIRTELRERTTGYILAAFGLVAGLAWNDAIKSLIEEFFPKEVNSLLAKFGYAVVITTLVVIASIYLNKVTKHKKEIE